MMGGRVPGAISSNSLESARLKLKNGGRAKTSCHQCKNNKDPAELLFCKNVKWGPGKKKGNMVLKHCRKKFCAQCMGKYETIERVDELFRLQENLELSDWQCPACADVCECAACWRRRHPNTIAQAQVQAQIQQNISDNDVRSVIKQQPCSSMAVIKQDDKIGGGMEHMMNNNMIMDGMVVGGHGMMLDMNMIDMNAGMNGDLNINAMTDMSGMALHMVNNLPPQL